MTFGSADAGGAGRMLAEIGELKKAGRFLVSDERAFALAEIADAFGLSHDGQVR